MMISSLSCCYIILCAVYSPCPPMVDNLTGKVIMVLNFLFADLSICYARTCVGAVLRESRESRLTMVFFGMATNSGMLIGAILCLYVDVRHRLFIPRNFCVSLKNQCIHNFRGVFLTEY
ncbi:hypothetical protein ACOME3_003478 [Neoechinorhynchus agilis]